jgi:hypothetical protein
MNPNNIAPTGYERVYMGLIEADWLTCITGTSVEYALSVSPSIIGTECTYYYDSCFYRPVIPGVCGCPICKTIV